MLNLVAKLSLSDMTVYAFLVLVRFEESIHSNSSHGSRTVCIFTLESFLYVWVF